MSVVAVVVPVYGHYDYAVAAVASAVAQAAVPIVVDDASPDAGGADALALSAVVAAAGGVTLTRSDNRGLTAGWNDGIRLARDLGADVTILTNSDVLFAPNSVAELAAGAGACDLAGPLTNAPGHVAGQDIRRVRLDYAPTDEPAALAALAAQLPRRRPRRLPLLNGFCLAALTDRWQRGEYAPGYAFNPACRMSGNEDELQRRWQSVRGGATFGLIESAFVFHYRSVTRGPRYGKGQQYVRTAPCSA